MVANKKKIVALLALAAGGLLVFSALSKRGRASAAEPTQPTLPAQPTTPDKAAYQVNWPRERVLLIGDSLSVGIAPFLESTLRERGVLDFKSIGRGGTNIKQWARDTGDGVRLNEALATFRPTLVLISLGTNDEATRKLRDYENFDVARQRAPHIKQLRDKLAGVRSVWLGPPAADKWSMDRRFRDLLQSSWGDLYFNTEAVAPQKGKDRVHFSTAGNKTWRDAIVSWLERGNRVA